MAKASTRRKASQRPVGRGLAVRDQLVAVKVGRAAGGGIAISAAGGYDIASGDRTFRSRSLVFEGQDRSLDSPTRQKLISAARDLDRNSLMSAMLDRWVDGVVGSSINFRPMTDDDGWNKAAYEIVRANMAAGNCEHRGFFDAAAMTRTMLRALGTDGEQLWIFTDEGRVQVIEAHQLGTPMDKFGPRKEGHCVDGVELGASGRPLGYWISDQAYGGRIQKSSDARFVAASDAIMPAYRKRASATHGVPVIAAGMKLHDRVDGYIDNESLAAEIDACLTFFIKSEADPDSTGGLTGRQSATGSDGTMQMLQKVEPGLITRLRPGDEVEQHGAKRPGQQFTPFVEMGLTMVGATVGVPLPLALLDFKRLNYSNARTMLLQMWQTWQIWHRQAVMPCWQWVYQRMILRAIGRGELTARPDAFVVKWLPRRWPWVDPLKEVQAVREEIAAGLGTITDQLELVGYTLDEYLAERQHELEAFARAGVPTTTIGGKPVSPTVIDEDYRRQDQDEQDEEEDDGDQENLHA